ncbi:hypothetical protein SAY86_019804 [Trapa natans]|uniref:Pentatricopeptide repeat-containing protein n=1 Tax=Trapa natans TaxID=22666 RepID=A0AAN7LZF4_TRANT|nr:hypothetical protein SAY86_019804 [Trapa natans]
MHKVNSISKREQCIIAKATGSRILRTVLVASATVYRIHHESSMNVNARDAHGEPCTPSLRLLSDIKQGQHPHLLIRLIRDATSHGYDSHVLQLHGHVIKSGLGWNSFVSAALLRFYVRIDLLKDACELFDEIPEPSLVSWNTLISGHVQLGEFHQALILFIELGRSGTHPDAYSLTAALNACGQLRFLRLGWSIHSRIIKDGVASNIFISNCLIDMYGKCMSLGESIQIFKGMPFKDNISWNSVIAACSRNQKLKQALAFFHEMHAPDTISYNEVITGISQFGDIAQACHMLSVMPFPNSSSWNSIITGCVNRDRAGEAMVVFVRMHSEGWQLDQFTFSSILSGIASLAALPWGMMIHCCTIKHCLDAVVVVGTALVDMYSKCGDVLSAESIFWSLPKTNLISWNAIISGFARAGNFNKLIFFYSQLLMRKDLNPDGITFLNILSGCSHCAMPLEVALMYFRSMMEDYGIRPNEEHCCSMVQVMGQHGEIWRALRMIHELGFMSSVSVWRALLGACEACRNTETAEIAASKLIELGLDEDYIYVTMSNIYASQEKWKDVNKVRKLMIFNGVRKGPGYSWIDM